jgi:hypothetical protein
MADSTISALPVSTVPLAGTEVLPIVQSGVTKKVSVENLTVGKTVTSAALLAESNNSFNPVTLATFRNTQIPATAKNIRLLFQCKDTVGTNKDAAYIQTVSSGNIGVSSFEIATRVSDVVANSFEITTARDVKATSGNFIPGTAAKGVNFTANTPAAGMTSQLLNWYEEGTFTPNQGAGLTLVGAFSSTGRYTRIGRQVSISGTVTGATSVAVAAAGVITSNLPFAAGTSGHGGATNVAINASATVICTGTSVTSAAAIAATATITFSATYFV